MLMLHTHLKLVDHNETRKRSQQKYLAHLVMAEGLFSVATCRLTHATASGGFTFWRQERTKKHQKQQEDLPKQLVHSLQYSIIS